MDYYSERVAIWKGSPVGNFDEYIKRVSFLNDSDFSIEKAKSVYQEGGMLERGIISALVDSILREFSDSTKHGIFDVSELFSLDDNGLIDECLEKADIHSVLQTGTRIVGISVTGTIQFRYSKSLIDAIREIDPSIKIVLGGSAITLAVRSNEANIKPLLDLSDFLIIGEGESSIVSLVKYVNDIPILLSEIPGLIYRSGNDTMVNPSSLEDIETVPKPCFDGIDFNQYMLPEPILPYHMSRGCFYGQCAFCNHDSEYRHNYRQKSVRKVIKEITELVQRTGLRNVQFTDEAIEPRFYGDIVRAMDENNEFSDISWFCYLRVSALYDEETVRLAAKNGCRMVMIGIESFNQRILNFIKKGHNAETAKENLRLFHKHGIKTFAWFMYGLPSETVDEAINDVNAIKEMTDYIDGLSYGRFTLSPNSDMSQNLAKYNILDYDKKNSVLLATHNNGIHIDVDKVRDAYVTGIASHKRCNYFSSNRYVLYTEEK